MQGSQGFRGRWKQVGNTSETHNESSRFFDQHRKKYKTSTPVMDNNLRCLGPSSMVSAGEGRLVKVIMSVERDPNERVRMHSLVSDNFRGSFFLG